MKLLGDRQPRVARNPCPKCANHAHNQVSLLVPDYWWHKCGSCGHAWAKMVAPQPEIDAAAEALGAFNIVSDVMACLEIGEPFVEFGIIEHRYSALRPIIYWQLLERFGHPRSTPSPVNVPMLLASGLVRLRRKRRVERAFGPATSPWTTEKRISYWAVAPARSDGAMLSWREYAQSKGLDLDA